MGTNEHEQIKKSCYVIFLIIILFMVVMSIADAENDEGLETLEPVSTISNIPFYANGISDNDAWYLSIFGWIYDVNDNGLNVTMKNGSLYCA
jgi:hypothetical protein